MSSDAAIVATAARDYLDAGWNPIPLPPRSKSPDDRKGWQNERMTADVIPLTFSDGSNIGLLLGASGNGRVDVDCDCAETIALAPAFLPSTGFIHGRPSRPRSHYWYSCGSVPEHRKFEFNGECLVELRTVGQTMCPPSVHPTGEQLAWDVAEGAPATVAADALSSAVRELAAGALIVRHYPATGSRHEFSMALSGFLMRQPGWSEDHVAHFVTAVATAAGDNELKDRENAVESTAQRLATGGKAIGGNRMREMMNPAALVKVSEWLGFAPRATRFALPVIEADHVAPDEIPAWPVDTLEGDYIADLTFQLFAGTPVPPQYLRETIVLVLAALADGKLGYPRHLDLPLRRYLALISQRAQSGKGESWKRIAGDTGEGGALVRLIEADDLKLQDGSGIGSGQFLAVKLEETPRMICQWDEASQLFQTSGQQHSTLLSALKTLYELSKYHSGSCTNKAHGSDDAHFSALLHSTYRTFIEGFATRGGIGDGLLSRFTLVYSSGGAVVPEWEMRDLPVERVLAATIGNLIPKKLTVPAIAEDARERMNEFAHAIYAHDHPHPDHVRRILELAKIDLLHRCIYSGSSQITLEMAERSILWGEHQLALRLALWPTDAKNEVTAMTQVLIRRLRKGSASANDLRRAASVDRDGTHELFARCLAALRKSGALIVLAKNSKNAEVYGLELDDSQKGSA